MSWRDWRAHLEQNTRRPIPMTAPPPNLSLRQLTLILRSLQRFQLGESGEGRVAHEIDSIHWPGVDADFRALIKLWVREEGRHARILALMVKDLGGTLLKRHWSTRGFELARRMLGLRCKLLVALAAGVAGVVFYGLLARALPGGALASALTELETDERAHLQFHSEIFGMLSSSPVMHRLIQGAWFTCGLCVSVLVWWEHSGTLEELGVPRAQTALRLWHCVRDVARRIRLFRPRPLSGGRSRSIEGLS